MEVPEQFHEIKSNGGLSPVDLKPMINTNFTSLSSSLPNQNQLTQKSNGFDFSSFENLLGDQKPNFKVKQTKEKSMSPAVWCVECEDGLIILGK